MILEELQKQKTDNGIIYLNEIDKSFEILYQQLLKKEKRFYDNDEVKLLPYSSQRNPYKKEWQLRVRTFLRFRYYLSTKKTKLNILDVGCGNGWLIGQLAKEFDHNYFGIDTNLVELEQADKLFSSEKVIFIYGDISKATLPTDTFNIVILNSTLQYFKDVDVLLKELLTISKSYGEVHILDTPFYLANDLIRVKNNSLKHFSSIGLPEMTQKFFHHTTDELKYFRNQLLYNPNSIKNKLSNIFFEEDSPFSWIMITR
ncbi:MAG: class I SAM-dependent methyltransferase [Ignavibacteriales bacterium]|nr:class I SAM-dependent methyltransferase [Ignavibacteriales bacterium]